MCIRDRSFAVNHVHRRQITENLFLCAGFQFPEETYLKKIYRLPVFIKFLKDVLVRPQLFPIADNFQSVNVMQIFDGGMHAWHYDLTDFVVTILLQKPEIGGEFEFAPFIRGELDPSRKGGRDGRVWEENYGDLEKLLDGMWPNTRIIEPKPGCLTLFNGLRSMHRVRTVYGGIQRMMAVFSYHIEEEWSSTDKINSTIYGALVNKFYEDNH